MPRDEVSIDGSAFTACTSPAEYGGLAMGVHTFSVRVVDANGKPARTVPATLQPTDGRLLLNSGGSITQTAPLNVTYLGITAADLLDIQLDTQATFLERWKDLLDVYAKRVRIFGYRTIKFD